jgi:DNA-binding GntR family transcriptional regulator
VSDVEEAQFIREALEVSVVQRLDGHGSGGLIAAGRVNLAQQAKAVAEGDRELFLELDEAFHRNLCEEAGLPKSWRVIQVVKLQMDRVRYLSLPEPGYLETLLAQHLAILEAVEIGEAKQAGARMAASARSVGHGAAAQRRPSGSLWPVIR